MSLPTVYDDGTASIANGATTVTGTGTFWSGTITAGDIFHDPAQGLVMRIESVTDYDELELAYPWPGTSLTSDAYEIWYTPDSVRSSERNRQLIEQMSVVEANGRGLFYTFSSTTTDSDPGGGVLRLNNATASSATAAYLDNLDANGATVSTVLDTWDDSTSTTRGQLWIRSIASPANFRAYSVTGSVVDGTGYRKLTLTHVGGSGSFADGDELMVAFARTGDVGIAGSTGTSDNRLLRADGTGGATIQNSAVTVDDSGNMSGVPVLTVSQGVKFPATQNPSSDANTLDDYEEGTWTPTCTPAGGSITSQTLSGAYTKVGRLVNWIINQTVTTIGSATGAWTYSTPFAYGGGAHTCNGYRAGWHGLTQYGFGSSTITMTKYDGTTPGAESVYVVGGQTQT